MNMMRNLFGLQLMNEVTTDAGAPAGTADAPTAPAAPDSLLGGPVGGAPKPEGEAPGTEVAKTEATTGAPDAYEAFSMPEGAELDETLLPEVQALFKDLNLPQDQAQKVLDKLLEIDAKRNAPEPTQEQIIQQQEQAIAQLNTDWAQQCRALPDIGGQNFDKSLETASKVMQRFGNEETRQLLTYSGLGSHPLIFKLFHAIGASMSEDTFVHGGAPGSGPKSIEQRLWPTQNQ